MLTALLQAGRVPLLIQKQPGPRPPSDRWGVTGLRPALGAHSLCQAPLREQHLWRPGSCRRSQRQEVFLTCLWKAALGLGRHPRAAGGAGEPRGSWQEPGSQDGPQVLLGSV